MNKIHESYTDFCNEGKDDKRVLYKFTFSEKFVDDDDKPHGPIWVLANNKDWKTIKSQAAIEMSGGFGEQKDEADAEQTMKYQKEHKDDTTAGTLTPLKKVGEIIKGLHKKAKVKESDNSSTNESKVAEAIMDFLETWYKKPGDKKALKAIEELTGVTGKTLLKILKDSEDEFEAFDNIMAAESMNESKVAEAIMDLLEKWYKKPGNKNVLKAIMDMTGIDDKKALEEILKRNVEASTAFNSIMAMESFQFSEEIINLNE